MKTYFDIKNPPFGENLTQHHSKIIKNNKITSNASDDFMFHSFLAIYFLIMTVSAFINIDGLNKQNIIVEVFSVAGIIGVDDLNKQNIIVEIFLVAGIIGAVFHGYMLFLEVKKFQTKRAQKLLPIEQTECSEVLSLRDENGHEEIQNYINQVIAQRQIENWELDALRNIATELDEERDLKIQQQRDTEACSKLYVNNF